MNGNFKARCIDTNGISFYTKWKIYEFKNGFAEDDDGFFITTNGGQPVKSFEILTKASGALWELVEDSKLERFAKGEIVLHTTTQKIYDKLMQWCDEKRIVWDSGWTASQINNWEEYVEDTAISNNYKCVSYQSKGLEFAPKGFYESDGYKSETLSLSDFGEPTPEPLSITIEFNGRETVAKLLENGKPVKQAVAKCLPTDKFSEAVGSQLALARLFEKKQKDTPTLSYKEAKRRAEVGEWIKIVKKGGHNPSLILGDIHLVVRQYDDGDIGTNKNNLFCEFEHDEYVVLEGYKHVQ